MTCRAVRPVLGMLGPIFVIAGCGGGDGVTPPPPPPPSLGVATIEVTGASSVAAGGDVQLIATAKNAAGAAMSGISFTWQTSSPALATVSNAGLLHGVSAGTVTVTARADGKSGNRSITVRDTTSLANTLSGKIERVDLTIPAGQQVTVTANAALVADSTLVIAGTIEVVDGATLTLYGGKLLRITGTIDGDSTGSFALGGGRVEIVGAPPTMRQVRLADAIEEVKGRVRSRDPILISGSTIIIGPYAGIETKDGRAGSKSDRNGRDGSNVEIGTTAAREASSTRSGKPDPGRTNTLVIDRSVVFPGAGGRGYDLNEHDDGTEIADIWTAVAGNGGRGGHLRIETEDLDLLGATVGPGFGGRGGHIEEHATEEFELRNGVRPDHGGEWVDITLGSGGAGGDLTVTADRVLHDTRFFRGAGGEAGSADLAEGDGRQAGPGGRVLIRTGRRGKAGAVNGPGGIAGLEAVPPNGAVIVISRGLNGAPGSSPQIPGGKGGSLEIIEPAGESGGLQGVYLHNVANGGPGFNGCAVSPRVNGSNGGPGGERRIPAVIPELTDEIGFRGGSGGSGVEVAGTGGARGQQVEGPGGPKPLGEPGANGSRCPAGTVTFSVAVANIESGIQFLTFVDGAWTSGPLFNPPELGRPTTVRQYFPDNAPDGASDFVVGGIAPAPATTGVLATIRRFADGSVTLGTTRETDNAVFSTVAYAKCAAIYSNRLESYDLGGFSLVSEVPLSGITGLAGARDAPLIIAHSASTAQLVTFDPATCAISLTGPPLQIPNLRAMDISPDGGYAVGVTRPLIGASQMIAVPIVAGAFTGSPVSITLPFPVNSIRLNGNHAYAAGDFGTMVHVAVNPTAAALTLQNQFPVAGVDRYDFVTGPDPILWDPLESTCRHASLSIL